jgi:hypothetical protein
MKTLRTLLRAIGHLSPLKLNRKLFHKPEHRPPHSGLKLAKTLWYSKEDHRVITVWAKERKITNIAMGHILVTSFIPFTEQQHEEE